MKERKKEKKKKRKKEKKKKRKKEKKKKRKKEKKKKRKKEKKKKRKKEKKKKRKKEKKKKRKKEKKKKKEKEKKMKNSLNTFFHFIIMLAQSNRHIRDEDITFDEGPHIYTIKGDSKTYTSVTTWNHHHFAEFDGEKIVTNMLRGRKMQDPEYAYYGMTKKQILDQWETNRNQASQAGTNMHLDIEHYYNGDIVLNDSVEYSYFKMFQKDYSHLKPYRTEWMVYYEEIHLAGSIDMIFENENGDLLIYDWKRCKEIVCDNGEYTKYAKTKCISHLPDTNFWHYALQLNMYKTILEHKYGKKVVELCLIRLHPDNPYKTYERIVVPFMETEMAALLTVRKAEIQRKQIHILRARLDLLAESAQEFRNQCLLSWNPNVREYPKKSDEELVELSMWLKTQDREHPDLSFFREKDLNAYIQESILLKIYFLLANELDIPKIEHLWTMEATMSCVV